MRTGPTGASERIHALDVLRGIAVFGILVVNVEQMFLPGFYANDPVAAIPGAQGTGLTWFLTDAFFENKFLTLFSLLFGVGFALQFEGRASQARGFVGRYLRRTLALLGFGVLHALFFYLADVLVIYALTSLLLIPWRRAKTRTVAIAGVSLLVITIAWGVRISGPSEADKPRRQRETVENVADIRETEILVLPERDFGMPRTIDIETKAGWSVTDEGRGRVPAASYPLPMPRDLAILVLDGNDETDQALVEYAVFSQGPLAAARFGRLSFMAFLLIIYVPVFLGWRTLALFLLGTAIVKAGLLRGPRDHFWRRTRSIGLGAGLPITLLASAIRWTQHETQSNWLYLGDLLHDISSLLLAAGIAAAAMIWASSGLRSTPLRSFAAVGRTALTNYIGQSVVMSLLATSYGFGLYGDLTRLQLLGLALGCFALQLLASSWWLKRFRIGPLEWIWRCITYWRIVPLVKEPGDQPAS